MGANAVIQVPRAFVVDGCVARHAIVEGPAQRIDQLGEPADSGSPGSPGPSLTMMILAWRAAGSKSASVRMGVVEQHLVLHAHELLLELPIGVRVRGEVSLHLGVERRVDQERRHARDVEELRPHGILQLALMSARR